LGALVIEVPHIFRLRNKRDMRQYCQKVEFILSPCQHFVSAQNVS